MPSTIETRAPYRGIGPLSTMPTSKVRNELAGSAVENGTGPAGDTIEAMRFLWTMVAVSAGIVEIVRSDLGPDVERFVCRNKATGALIDVCRSLDWTEQQERRYVDALDRALNTNDPLDDLGAAFEPAPAEPALALASMPA